VKRTSTAGIGIITIVRTKRSILIEVVHLGPHVVGQQSRLWLHAIDRIIKIVIRWWPTNSSSIRVVRVVNMGNLRLQIGYTSSIVEEHSTNDGHADG